MEINHSSLILIVVGPDSRYNGFVYYHDKFVIFIVRDDHLHQEGKKVIIKKIIKNMCNKCKVRILYFIMLI